MSTLIYLNLFIDNDWDELKVIDSIYPIRLESSKRILDSYLQWGVYEGNQNDFVLVTEKMDPSFRKYLEHYFPLPVEILPGELNQLSNSQISSFYFAGVSSIEENILKLKPVHKPHYPSAEFYKKINSKEKLVEIAKKNNFKFPKTETIPLRQIPLLSKADLPVVLKYPNSAGGRGVFVITKEQESMTAFIGRQLEDFDPELIFLKQEYVEIKSHFYTLADTDFSDTETFGFNVFYDKSNNSKKHIPEKALSEERKSAAKAIADSLKRSGYEGSFGFDGFIDTHDNVYPAVDLNVRLDKSRLIHNLARKFKLESCYYEFRRERFHGRTYSSFDEFWNRIQPQIKHDHFFFIPVLFSNMFHSAGESDLVEISFFVGSYRAEASGFEEWLQQVYQCIGVE